MRMWHPSTLIFSRKSLVSAGLMPVENKKELQLEIDTGNDPYTMVELINELKTNHLKEKEEMFVQGNTVRPGIIVLVNDTDWELEGTTDY